MHFRVIRRRGILGKLPVAVLEVVEALGAHHVREGGSGILKTIFAKTLLFAVITLMEAFTA